jgi:hypothetical protein
MNKAVTDTFASKLVLVVVGIIFAAFVGGYLTATYRLWWLPKHYNVAPPDSMFGSVEKPSAPEGTGSAYASADAPVTSADAPVTLVPTEARASTWMNRAHEVHPAKGAFDGDFSTNWTENHAGRGEGQWVEAIYASPVRVTEVVVATGIVGGCGTQASPWFEKNSRLKTFRIVLSDGTEIKASAADGERCVIVPVPAKETKSVKLVVDTVWPGSAYRDLGIAEIKIVGTKP